MNRILAGTLIIVAGLLLMSASTVMAACYPDNENPCNGNFDYDCDVDGADVAEFLTHFGRSPFFNPCPSSGPAMVPKTGQTTSYADGNDGDLEKGVAWLDPRFSDNLDGTVTDNLT
jgi:hypothetical protein